MQQVIGTESGYIVEGCNFDGSVSCQFGHEMEKAALRYVSNWSLNGVKSVATLHMEIALDGSKGVAIRLDATKEKGVSIS